MKLSKLSQLGLVSAAGLLVATFLTSCQIVTIDYVYVAASSGQAAGSAGQIYGFAVDSESGAIRSALPAVSSGGTDPVAMAITSDYSNVYVANQGNDSVVHFSVADSGALTVKESLTLGGTPVSIAVNSADTYLYVISVSNNSASLNEYSLSNGVITGSAISSQPLTLPQAAYSADIIVPTAVTVLADNSGVYVAAYDQSAYNPGGATSSNANPGWLFGFKVGSGGALAPTAGSPYQAGVKPSALAADPTDRFVYVTDYASNGLIGYTLTSTGALNFMINGPFKTGDEPTAIAIDPRGLYIYVANSLDNDLSSYTVTLSTGTPSAVVNVTGPNNNVTQTDPVSIVIDPSLGRFIYTANHLDNSISGFRLNPNTGALSLTQDTPYPISGALPTAVVAIPHGSHATQSVAP